jgi:hypothetical protein
VANWKHVPRTRTVPGDVLWQRFGNPAAMEPELFRPVTLRPRLSTGLPFRFVTANLVFTHRSHYEFHHVEYGTNARIAAEVLVA